MMTYIPESIICIPTLQENSKVFFVLFVVILYLFLPGS